MKVLFKSYALLGDGLQTTPSMLAFIDTWKEREPGKLLEVDVATHANQIAVIYQRLGYPVNLRTQPEPDIDDREYDFVFRFDIGKAFPLGAMHNWSASKVFGLLLGIVTKTELPVYRLPEDARALRPKEKQLVLFQPYSRSCSSWTGEPANKRWVPDEKWTELYNRIKTEFPDKEIRVVGAKEDYYLPGIPENEHWLGRALDEIAAAQACAQLVVSIDNGASHLAASQMANLLELYPKCLPPNWMGKFENPNYRQIYCLPSEVQVDFVFSWVQKLLTEEPELLPVVGGEDADS